ncbi:MAG: hypothetical protein EOP19_22050, partial [Hyphomicrobiales bacterium]
MGPDHLFLDVFNAGTIETEGIDWGLSLTAPSLSYRGAATAFITQVSPDHGGGALSLQAWSGNMSVLVEHGIVGANGIRARGEGFIDDEQEIAIELRSGTITADAIGLDIARYGAGTVDLVIGKDASIVLTATDPSDAPHAAFIIEGAPARVTLAGRVEGQWQASTLGGGDDVLELQPGYGLEGSINGRLGTDELVLGGSGEGDFDLADIHEPDPKTGSSTWTLHGAAARNIDLDILGGTINVGSTAALLPTSRFTIGADARLSGSGTLGVIEVSSGATLAPGDFSAGTMAAAEVIFQPHSIFEIMVTAEGARSLQAEAVTILGGKVWVPNVDLATGAFDILLSGQPLGSLDRFALVDLASDFFEATLNYDDPGKVVLELSRSAMKFSDFATTPRQAAVAAILDGMGAGAPYFLQFGGMAPEDRGAFLEQLAGSDLAVTGGALLQSAASLAAASLGRVQQQSGALGTATPVMGFAAFTDDNWTDGLYPSVWARLIAGTSTLGGAASGSVAMVGGADVQLGDDWTLGLLAGIG